MAGRKVDLVTDEDLIANRVSEERTMQFELRQAAFNAINEADIVAIVAKQVAMARKGDAKAVAFVMDYLLGMKCPPPTFVQVNVDRKAESREGGIVDVVPLRGSAHDRLLPPGFVVHSAVVTCIACGEPFNVLHESKGTCFGCTPQVSSVEVKTR